MFGHPGISALEYAGQVEAIKEESVRLSQATLKRKSGTSTTDQQTAVSTPDGSETETGEMSVPLHFIDEFGFQQRRRGTFVNHTPRNFEMRSSQTIEVYRPTRAESENYSRPLSRQSSMVSGSLANTSQHGHSPSANSGTFGNQSILNHDVVAELDSTELDVASAAPEAYVPYSKAHRRSLSAPLIQAPTHPPGGTELSKESSRDASLRSTSLTDHQPKENKRQRRQTPFKIVTSRSISSSRHAPMEPLVAKQRRKGTSQPVETIGDVPVDMDREVSAEMGTFGVIQRYFDSQGGGPVIAPQIIPDTTFNDTPPTSPFPETPQRLKEPIAIFPVDELEMPYNPPPVPDRSPKRLTNPSFPLPITPSKTRDSDFMVAAEGQYSPYDDEKDMFHVSKKRTQGPSDEEQHIWIGSPTIGRLAPPILGHDAITASSDLGLNSLAFYLRHTGPPSNSQSKPTQHKKGMKLFKARQRGPLATRVGSVEGSPERARNHPKIPACTREMMTSGGARHLKIIVAESPAGVVTTLPLAEQRAQRRSRHAAISFTEEMLNPLGSPAVEDLLANFDTLDIPDRSVSAPLPRSPRSPKRSPKAVPVDKHPLQPAPTRDDLTRARKLRDLQRIKRKPTPCSLDKNTTTAAPPTPAHTPHPSPEPIVEEESPANKMSLLEDRVILLQRQNTQLAEALAKIVGLELEDGDLKSEEVLEAFRRLKGAAALSAKG
ncbi:hypothetical protein DE146DRAFT_613071 [Phaeosphaeria sp. MPI-PUGE-AT-0046c]|nr:hypothetical protein DE146DRAFT_613071 [Phaeosphaeria sp. MPI-PUGE-AT-0046c]